MKTAISRVVVEVSTHSSSDNIRCCRGEDQGAESNLGGGSLALRNDSTELPCDMMVDRVGKNRSVRIWVESGAKVGTVVPMSF